MDEKDICLNCMYMYSPESTCKCGLKILTVRDAAIRLLRQDEEILQLRNQLESSGWVSVREREPEDETLTKWWIVAASRQSPHRTATR